MLDMLRYQGITPLLVDMVPSGTNGGGSNFDPSPYLASFDNVLHLFFEHREQESEPRFRVLKSVGNDFRTDAVPIEWRKS
jgi:hypothetical protein